VDPEFKLPVRFFGRGYEYKFLGLFETDRHLLIVEARDGPRAPFIIGTDSFGRDLLSRIFHGTRISLTIGLVGVSISIVLGVTLGGLSGFYGGFIDTIVQRMIEILRSIPTIPLWLGLAASLPRDWSIMRIYLAITVILSLYAWTELARVVRGRFLAMREEDFTMAAKLAGASDTRIIFRHMVPNFTSHLIATATLAVPFMIISETALSFLGVGLVPPAISWGVLLKSTQNVQSVALYPWLMLIALPVIVAVLAFNFIGDGLRDAADPYA
jgi:peptide/nickel transport system permease protein